MKAHRFQDIAILLATYNGEKYLIEQFESLFAQTVQDFVVYVRDDASTDKTCEIIEKYQVLYPNRIIADYAEVNSGNPKHTFFNMMIKIKCDYVFLCDQDDVWLPNKIEKTLNKIKTVENELGTEIPILVHTDLTVVDENLGLINKSYRRMLNGGWEKRHELKDALIMTVVTGCTVVYNRVLADLISYEPDFCVMHDWWLLLVASAFGVVGHIDESTILYRQHSENNIGAYSVSSLKLIYSKISNGSQIKSALEGAYKQTEEFLLMYGDMLTERQVTLLMSFSQMGHLNKINRIVRMFGLHTWKHGLSRKIAQVVFG